MELVAEFLQQNVDRGRVGNEWLPQRLLAAEHVERVGLPDHDAVDEQSVNSARMLERLAKTRRWFQVEGQRNRAVLQIEVDQCHPAAASVRDAPGDSSREQGRTDTAARAGDRHKSATAIVLPARGTCSPAR